MSASDLAKLVQQDPAGFVAEMLSKVQHATAACNAAVPRVHVINGTLEEGLLGEVFSNHGIDIDKNPVACVALHVYPEQQEGELASLYVGASHENQGIGRELIRFVVDKARDMGLRELLVLSTQAYTCFISKGSVVEGTPNDVPPQRREKYGESGRNSKVLVKKLNEMNGE